MGVSYPISRAQSEKSDGISKSIDHPSKLCGGKLSGDHYRVLGSMQSLHFRRLPKCLQVADGAINLGDCTQ
jgi:hypothetical protein